MFAIIVLDSIEREQLRRLRGTMFKHTLSTFSSLIHTLIICLWMICIFALNKLTSERKD